jgi:SNF2 family DNA or RNA helicase
VSAVTASVEKACQQLNLFLKDGTPALKVPQAGETSRKISIKLWQATGVHWMVEQEKSPVKCGILGDGCGLGKTLEALLLVYLSSKTERPKGQAFKPTLILVPTSLSTHMVYLGACVRPR